MNQTAKSLGNLLIILGFFIVLTSINPDTSLDDYRAIQEQHEHTHNKVLAGFVITAMGIIYKIEVK